MIIAAFSFCKRSFCFGVFNINVDDDEFEPIIAILSLDFRLFDQIQQISVLIEGNDHRTILFLLHNTIQYVGLIFSHWQLEASCCDRNPKFCKKRRERKRRNINPHFLLPKRRYCDDQHECLQSTMEQVEVVSTIKSLKPRVKESSADTSCNQ
jgi:hypothetical protein